MVANSKFIKIIRSVVSPESLMDLIMVNYQAVLPTKISLLSIGDNDHYLVKTKNTNYIVRIYRHNKHWLPTKSHLLFEIHLLNFLYANNISVSYPIKRADRSYVGTLDTPEGTRYWALFSFASGSDMQFNYRNCYNYGEIISRMHNISNNFRSLESYLKTDQSFLLDLPLIRIVNYLGDTRKNDVNYLKKLIESLKLEINNFNQKNYKNEWGIIGGDFHGGNHFCNKNGDITLFDFDLCGYGWRTYDLAVFKWALFNICRRGPKVQNRQLLWQAFLEGYKSNIYLNADQLKIIPAFIQARQIWLMGSETTYPDKILSKTYWDLMFKGLRTSLKTVGTYREQTKVEEI